MARSAENGSAGERKPQKRSRAEAPADIRDRFGTSGMGTVEDAIELATRLHRGQMDKYHLPYIIHVFGVAARCRTIEEKIVAFLHDTVEDEHITLEALRELGFSERVLAAVDCLSRRKRESYDAFVERIAPNTLARIVKLADLEDNMDVRRSNRAMKQKDAERMEKYRLAWQRLATITDEEEQTALR
jgi:(p)ppGpp synthase/HD superfamily hydrolase